MHLNIFTGATIINQATVHKELSHYFLEAAIEFQYHIAPDFGSINWEKVLAIHEKFQQKWPSGRGRLNYLIVYSRVYGSYEALQELNKLEEALCDDHVYYTYRAVLLEELHQKRSAELCLLKAVKLVQNDVERRYLQRRLAQLIDS